MSRTYVVGLVPGKQPVELAEYRNSHGFHGNIWGRMIGDVYAQPARDRLLKELWGSIETLPEWKQVPLVLTFDTGVIPFRAYAQAAEAMAEFEAKLPYVGGGANHIPAVADLLRSVPEVPFIKVYGSMDAFQAFMTDYDEELDNETVVVPAEDLYMLPQHRNLT